MNPPSASVDLFPSPEPQPEHKPLPRIVLVNVRADEVRIGDRIRNLGLVEGVALGPHSNRWISGQSWGLSVSPDRRLAVWRMV